MTTTNQKTNPKNCTHEQLFKVISKNPTPQIFRYDNYSSEQYVAFTIALIILLNQHGDASKPQAEAKGVNTHQAALFASSTQGLPVLRKYEQQDWQAAQEGDKIFHFHYKQDAEDNARLVDGDDTVSIRLVDYDLVDGQLAHAAGGPPSTPHEWMVSNPLSHNPSTVQAQNGFG